MAIRGLVLGVLGLAVMGPAAGQTGRKPGGPAARHATAAVAPTGPIAVIDTTMGRLTCQLYAAQAPELAANFVSLAQGTQDWKDPATGATVHGKGFYDGTAIFGAVDSIGGGDRLGDLKGPAGDPLTVKKAPGLLFDQPGRLAMGINNKQISRSIFLITDHANAELDKGEKGAVFGQCDSASAGLVARISHELLTTENHPKTPVAINHISIVQPGEPLPAVAADVPASAVVPQPTPYPQSIIPAPDPSGPTALIETSLGTLRCRLFEQEAPVATRTFIGLAQGTRDWTMPKTHTVMHGKPFYNGLLFDRVLPDFMIQNQNYPGGSNGGGEIGIKYGIESYPGLTFDRPGRLAMANDGPNTNDSSFFITELPRHALDERFTIFGQCDEASVALVTRIAHVERDAHNHPLTPVVIRKVTVVSMNTGQGAPARPQ